MATCLTATDIHKSFGSFHALSGVSLTMNEGEVLALLGANGAGKTTLIKVLSTLLTKDAGRIRIHGYDLDHDESAIRSLIGYVGQDTERSAYARLTGRENLEFFGRLRGIAPKQLNARINRLNNDFDFGSHLDKQFMQLSGGQKQTVVIMRALLHDPPIIILDEPTKGLDPLIARKIRKFLKEYVSTTNKSLLLTSHILTEVEELADRVALIKNGVIPIIDLPTALKDSVGARDWIEINHEQLPPSARERLITHPDLKFYGERTPGWDAFALTDFYKGTEAVIQILKEEKVQPHFRHHAVTLEDAFVHFLGQQDEHFDT